VVSLDERREYILERYGRNDPERLAAIRANCRSWQEVEAEIFKPLPFAPSELPGLIDLDPATCDYSGRQVPAKA